MIIDILCFIALFAGFTTGFARGLIRTVMVTGGVVLAFLLAVRFSETFTNILAQVFSSEALYLPLVGFCVTFILIVWILFQMASLFEGLIQRIGIGFINKFLGGSIFGVLGIILFSALVWFTDQIGLISDPIAKESYSYPYLMELPEIANEYAKIIQPNFIEFWDNLNTGIEQISIPNIAPNDNSQPPIDTTY